MYEKHPTVTYRITFKSVPGNYRTEPLYRIRGLLKGALRGYGFKCLNIEEIIKDEKNGPEPTTPTNTIQGS